MGVKIGLDFGTHFTKICVEDSTDKRNKSYLFHRFYNMNGEPSFMLPSVVQINKDNTLSYGFVSEDEALRIDAIQNNDPPQKPSEPVYQSYIQLPEIDKPDYAQFTSCIYKFEGNNIDTNCLKSIKAKCLEHFNWLVKRHTWTNITTPTIQQIISDFTLPDIELAKLENGDIDIRKLVSTAVSRSFSQRRKIFLQEPIPMIDLSHKQLKRVQKQEEARQKALYEKQRAQDDKILKAQQLARKQMITKEHELYERARREYLGKCIRRDADIAKDKKSVDSFNERVRKEYEQKMKLWMEYEQNKDGKLPATFKSFKQVVFSDGYDWRFTVNPMLVSIWFLCYVFFDLDKEYGTQNLTVCMGTSSGQNNWERNKMKASRIILTVYDLIENVFKHDREKFLSATFDELMSVTNIKPFSQAAKDANEIYVFPEAYANLNPLAKQKKFDVGVNSVVDIGGGTTDISFFVASEGSEVKIFDYVSIPYGVNAIEKDGVKVHYEAVGDKMHKISVKITGHAQRIGVKRLEAAEIVTYRPVVFTGGGSMKPELRRPYFGFSDIMHLSSSLLNSYSIDEVQQVAEQIPLLSTSLGLALCNNDDSKIPIITYKTLFATLAQKYKNMQ